MSTQYLDPMNRGDRMDREPMTLTPTGFPTPRCQASARNGNQCQRASAPGQRVCNLHGAGSPQAQRKAKLRLAELVAPAIATLAKEMTKAETSSDRMKAANSILDRAGWGRVQKVEAHDAREILLQRIMDMREDQLDDHDHLAQEIAPHISIAEIERAQNEQGL